MPSAIIQAENVTKRFGALTAVDDVSYVLHEHEIAGIIGSNGAGKTTFFNLLTGYHQPDEGSIRYRGEDVTRMTPEQRVDRGMMRTFQLTATFDNLTVVDNLVLSFFRAHRKPSLLQLFTNTRKRHRSDPKVLESEVRRMLSDRRAATLMDNFAAQWLGLRTLTSVAPDKQLFPEFDAALAAAFDTETRLFVNSLIRENRSVLDLLRANYTYLDERLALHYGIAGVTGPGFRRVTLSNSAERGGLLGHGSVLLLTSHATRTSPVLRGKWILDNLLKSWDIEHLKGLTDKAEAAQQYLCSLPERYRKVAERFANRRRDETLTFAWLDLVGAEPRMQPS